MPKNVQEKRILIVKWLTDFIFTEHFTTEPLQMNLKLTLITTTVYRTNLVEENFVSPVLQLIVCERSKGVQSGNKPAVNVLQWTEFNVHYCRNGVRLKNRKSTG